MYGGGPDQDAAAARAESLNVDLEFHGPIDHTELAFTHKVGSLSADHHVYNPISILTAILSFDD
jgi:hypothetical protein